MNRFGFSRVSFHISFNSVIGHKIILSVFRQGGLSKGYKNYIAETELPDDTYSEEGLALFRVQGNGPDNMQAIQVEPVSRAPYPYSPPPTHNFDFTFAISILGTCMSLSLLYD